MRPRTAYLTLEHASTGRRRMHAAEVAALLGIHERTVRRWIRGAQAPEPCALRLLEILALGVLPWPDWRGFSVDPSDGRLHSGNGYAWSRGELEHWSLVVQRAEHMRRFTSADASMP